MPDPIYQPKVATIEGYTVDDVKAKVTEALKLKRYTGYTAVGEPSYEGNRKMFSQAIQDGYVAPEPIPGQTI